MIDWSPIELNNKNVFDEIVRSDYPVFIDYWAAWCPPCRMMDPLIDEMAQLYEGKVLIRKLNTDLYRTVLGKLKIHGVPTYIIYKKGEEVWRTTGAVGKKKLKQVLDGAIDE